MATAAEKRVIATSGLPFLAEGFSPGANDSEQRQMAAHDYPGFTVQSPSTTPSSSPDPGVSHWGVYSRSVRRINV